MDQRQRRSPHKDEIRRTRDQGQAVDSPLPDDPDVARIATRCRSVNQTAAEKERNFRTNVLWCPRWRGAYTFSRLTYMSQNWEGDYNFDRL